MKTPATECSFMSNSEKEQALKKNKYVGIASIPELKKAMASDLRTLTERELRLKEELQQLENEKKFINDSFVLQAQALKGQVESEKQLKEQLINQLKEAGFTDEEIEVHIKEEAPAGASVQVETSVLKSLVENLEKLVKK